MSTDRIEEPLPESLMRAIGAACASDALTIPQKLEAALLIATGYGLYRQAETIDPTKFAIPESQWTTISELLLAASKQASPVGSVNVALTWMNSGPSAY